MTKFNWRTACGLLVLALGMTPAGAEPAKKAPEEPPMRVRLVHSAQAGCVQDCPEWISAEGKLFPGQALKQFQAVLRRLKGRKPPVFLNSGGGDMRESLAIGRLLRAKGLDTAVLKTEIAACDTADTACRKLEQEGIYQGKLREAAFCGSACANILAGGVRRFAGRWTYTGVHQAKAFTRYTQIWRRYRTTWSPGGGEYKELISEERGRQKTVETKPGEDIYREIEQYFVSMGVSKDIMPLLRSAPNTSIHWMTAGELTSTRLITSRTSGLELLPGLQPQQVLPPYTGPVWKGPSQTGADWWLKDAQARMFSSPAKSAERSSPAPAAQTPVPAPPENRLSPAPATPAAASPLPVTPPRKPLRTAALTPAEPVIPTPASGQIFRDCPDCPAMVVIPAGRFVMGAAETFNKIEHECGPQHEVVIRNPFAAGETAVTFDQWDDCVADGGCNGYTPPDNGWGSGGRPVINVSWYDAKAYAAWLSAKTGKVYRLLTEAEFEYAARAGSETRYWWGASITPAQANYDGPLMGQAGGVPDAYRARTLPVKSFQPNPWGLYQVHGNTDSWVEDCSSLTYKGAPADGAAVTSAGCKSRVARGGSWADTPVMLSAWARTWTAPDRRNTYRGFRLARELR